MPLIEKIIEKFLAGGARNSVGNKYLISEGELRDIIEECCEGYVEKGIVKNCVCGKCF